MRCAFTATGCGRGIKGKSGLRWLAVLFNMAGNKIMQVTELAVHLWGGGITEVIGLIENALHTRAEFLRDNQVLIAAIGRSVAVGIQVPVEQLVEYRQHTRVAGTVGLGVDQIEIFQGFFRFIPVTEKAFGFGN